MSIQPTQSVEVGGLRLVVGGDQGEVTKTLRCIKTRSTTPTMSTAQRQKQEPPVKTKKGANTDRETLLIFRGEAFDFCLCLTEHSFAARAIFFSSYSTAIYSRSHHEVLYFSCVFSFGYKHAGRMEPSPQVRLCHLPGRHHEKHD